jgi:hypothetical protein
MAPLVHVVIKDPKDLRDPRESVDVVDMMVCVEIAESMGCLAIRVLLDR